VRLCCRITPAGHESIRRDTRAQSCTNVNASLRGEHRATWEVGLANVGRKLLLIVLRLVVERGANEDELMGGVERELV
jgi:hypothetical protein